MSESSKLEWVCPPEQFTGCLVVADQRIPISLVASADPSGSLALDVEPISISDSPTSALILMQQLGRPGNTIDEFRLECESADGKRLWSDSAYLTGCNRTSEGMHIGLRTSEASLSMVAREHHDRPALCFSLLAFSCFPPVRVETPIGKVLVQGATRSAATDKITGLIAAEAPKSSHPLVWRASAEHLLKHLCSVLAFARGAPLPVTITQFYQGACVEVTFHEVGGGYASHMPPIPRLNLEPIVSTAVASIDIVDTYRDTFETAVGWLLVPTTHDEVRFLSGMTALESIAARSLNKSETFILGSSASKKFTKRLRAFIDAQNELSDTTKDAIKEKLPELNRRSFAHKISVLMEHWHISRNSIDVQTLAGLVKLRNTIVHQGGVSDDEDLWPSILVIREFVVRLILSMLRFEGTYQCYTGGRHTRNFPHCNSVD